MTEYDAKPLPPLDPERDVSTTAYWDYHGLKTMLSAKNPVTASQDEDLFISVHQICEIAFNQMIVDLERSLTAIRQSFEVTDGPPEDLSEAVYFLSRVLPLYDVANRTMPILSGMRAFAEFRTSIGPSSGFQSYQFRRLEIMSGVDRPYWRGGTADASGEIHTAEKDLDRHFGAAIAEWFETYRHNSLAHWWRVAIDRFGDAARVVSLQTEWATLLRRYETAQRQFHRRHLGLATTQLKKVGADVGTGGTDFRDYLSTYEREVAPLFPGLPESARGD